MEPMNLGSPVGSPAAPSHTTPVSTTASTYLPSFLMGASPATSVRISDEYGYCISLDIQRGSK